MEELKKENRKVTLSNKIIDSRQIVYGKRSMSLHTAKLLRLLVSQVAKADSDFKTYKADVKEIAEYLGIGENLYRDIKKIVEEMMGAVIYIPKDEKHWKMLHWISTAELDGSQLTLRLSDEISKYVLELNAYFTMYALNNILNFRSVYSIRLYEILISKKNKFRVSAISFSITEIREMLNCKDKFKQIKELKEKVIEPATKEISEKSDLIIDSVQYKKTGRTITSVTFNVAKQQEDQSKPLKALKAPKAPKEPRGPREPQKRSTSYNLDEFMALSDEVFLD